MPAARDQLLGLHEEFDIANAAAPELDVVAFDRDRAVALELMHAPLHRVDVGDRGIVEIFPPDEGRELAQELLAGLLSPATARALISAARSQFCPKLS